VGADWNGTDLIEDEGPISLGKASTLLFFNKILGSNAGHENSPINPIEHIRYDYLLPDYSFSKYEIRMPVNDLNAESLLQNPCTIARSFTCLSNKKQTVLITSFL